MRRGLRRFPDFVRVPQGRRYAVVSPLQQHETHVVDNGVCGFVDEHDVRRLRVRRARRLRSPFRCAGPAAARYFRDGQSHE